MNTLNYRGFSSPISYDDENAVFMTRLGGVAGARPIRAGNLAALRRAFEREVDIHLSARDVGLIAGHWCGQVPLRIDSAVHAQCVLAAEAAGVSVVLWIERTLRSAAERRLAAEGVRPARAAPSAST